MPTTRDRISITATDAVEDALGVAARRWPEDKDNPRLLLLHLIEEGADLVRAQTEGEQRKQAVLETAGAFSDVYDEDYLTGLREDWPA